MSASYNGPDAVVAPDSYAIVFLTDSPGTLTGFRVTAGTQDTRLRVRVTDKSGRPVAISVSSTSPDGSGEFHYYCDASDVTTAAFPGASELYIAVVAGACPSGAAAPTLSAPTQGTVTVDLLP